jgi:predicted RND superfamily exporter protein
MAITIFDFVPEQQVQKQAILSDVRFFMPRMDHVSLKPTSCRQNAAALNSFEKTVRKAIYSATGDARTSLLNLQENLQRFKTLQKDPEKGCNTLRALEQSMLSTLPDLFKKLKLSLAPKTVRFSDIPKELVDQYVSIDGRYRIQVFPKENIVDRDALVRFVHAVYGLTPDATDAPVTVYEAGMAIISSFQLAVLLALVSISVFLLLAMRSFFATILILIPLALAMLLTAAASVLFNIPLNFANVIVVPLLLGVGVHNGILFTLRYQTEPPADGNMLKTSTARAIFFSSLTTMTSTGSLAFSSHRGIASIGILLTLCFGFLIFSTLILMPAMFQLFGNRMKDSQRPR